MSIKNMIEKRNQELREFANLMRLGAMKTKPLTGWPIGVTPNTIYTCAIGAAFWAINQDESPELAELNSQSIEIALAKRFPNIEPDIFNMIYVANDQQYLTRTEIARLLRMLANFSLTPVHWFFYEEEEPDHQDEDLITVYIGDLFLLTKPYNSICEIS